MKRFEDSSYSLLVRTILASLCVERLLGLCARFQDIKTYRAMRNFSMLGDCASGSYSGSFTVDVRHTYPCLAIAPTWSI